MSINNPPPEFVIRFGDVRIDGHELTDLLGIELDRYGPSRHGSSHYAQISMSSDADEWASIADFLDAVGPKIKGLIDQRLIGSATIDFAVFARDVIMSISSTVPANVALRAGQNLIDIETSIYLSDSAA